MNAEVCAAIITYHPGEDFVRAVTVLRPQVGQLVVVDNHSPSECVEKLRKLSREFDFVLIENPDNYGLGTALNQSIRWVAPIPDYEFILFFDQDSLMSDTFVAKMVNEYRRHAPEERIFLVTPQIIHRRTGNTYIHYEYHGKFLFAQTSGSLMPMKVFSEAGLFCEELFIDYVDYELCLRFAGQGWTIAYCQSAVLWHDPGNAKQLSILGLRKLTTANYSPLRRYYLMRNGLWTVKKYGARYPGWALGHIWLMFKGAARVLIFEQNRATTVLMWLRAIRDVLRSRFGRYPRAMHA